jgi:hypothetical protein
MVLSQIAYAAVILAGYVSYFVPEVLQQRGAALPEANSSAHLQPRAAGELGDEQLFDKDFSAAETASGAPSPAQKGHSMRLRNRKGHPVIEQLCSDNSSGAPHSGASADTAGAAPSLLDRRTLRLCGSFTLQVLHFPDCLLYYQIWSACNL